MTRGEEILLCIRFKGGATKKLSLPLPLKGWQYNVTDPEIVEIVDELLANHNYAEIATILNKRGYKSGQGYQFDKTIVKGITHSYQLKTRFARLRATGKLTADEVANLLCVTVATVRRWGRKAPSKRTPTTIRTGAFTSILELIQLYCRTTVLLSSQNQGRKSGHNHRDKSSHL